MAADRLLHLIRAPAAAAPSARPSGHPQQHSRVHLTPSAAAGMRRVAVSCSGSGSSSADEEGMTYKGAGVDIDAGTELVRRIRKLAPGIGGFGGLYPHGALFFFLLTHCRFF
jgi:phosphoribosylformylglycinamidine cyclo-ligase